MAPEMHLGKGYYNKSIKMILKNIFDNKVIHMNMIYGNLRELEASFKIVILYHQGSWMYDL